jgi:hypothetical protein
LKKSRFSAQLVSGLLLAAATLSLSACGNIIYHEPEYQYSGRTVPPSGLLQRVMVSLTANGSAGGLQILDGLRDTRSNVQDTIQSFPIKGYSAAQPIQILNFPEQQFGYVLSYTDGVLGAVNYATESGAGTAATFGGNPPSVAASHDGTRFAGAVNGQGILEISVPGGTYSLNLPNVDKVVINQGNSVILAMVRNSNALYRVIKLPQTATPVVPPGSIDCEPLQIPVYCVVPVGPTTGATSFDHPVGAYFSLDGTSVYVLNCGPECGGTTAGITVLQSGPLQADNIPTVNPASQPPPLATLPVANPIPVPGGVTEALADGTTLYLAGQSIQASGVDSGLLGGNLTAVSLTNYTVSAPLPISDGTHTRILFADDNTLWIGSNMCATGVRAATAAQQMASQGFTTNAGNYNCLTRATIGEIAAFSINGNTVTFTAPNSFAAGQTVVVNGLSNGTYMNGQTLTVLSSGLSNAEFSATVNHANVAATIDAGSAILQQPQIVPAVTQSNVASVSPVIVSFPNTDQNQFYYDNLTGLCWVQNYHKVYTAYGGQIHAFNTVDGTERDNTYITVQGTALDVAYMDALTNDAN